MLNLAPWVCFPRVFPSAFSLSHSASHPAAVLFLPLPLSLQLCCRGLEANSSIYDSRNYNFFFFNDDPHRIDNLFLSNQDILKHKIAVC